MVRLVELVHKCRGEVEGHYFECLREFAPVVLIVEKLHKVKLESLRPASLQHGVPEAAPEPVDAHQPL